MWFAAQRNHKLFSVIWTCSWCAFGILAWDGSHMDFLPLVVPNVSLRFAMPHLHSEIPGQGTD
jgi:hypothetical protein